MRGVNDFVFLCHDSAIHASMMVLAAPSIGYLSYKTYVFNSFNFFNSIQVELAKLE
jgi:hypothetical protein